MKINATLTGQSHYTHGMFLHCVGCDCHRQQLFQIKTDGGFHWRCPACAFKETGQATFTAQVDKLTAVQIDLPSGSIKRIQGTVFR